MEGLKAGRPKDGGGSSRPPPAAAAALAAEAGAGRTHQVKVKHIITREVNTDEANFKDVVQRLTGKDSRAARAAAVSSVDGGGSRWSDGAVGGGARVSNHAADLFEDAVLGMQPSSEEMKRLWRGY